MHTPDQARELWCPMVRIARREVVDPETGWAAAQGDDIRVVAGCNTDALGRMRVPNSCHCIAEKCAMWRWAPGIDPSWKRPEQPPGSFMPPPMVRSTHGYCGVAGRPDVK